jgi:hypothetical protein
MHQLADEPRRELVRRHQEPEGPVREGHLELRRRSAVRESQSESGGELPHCAPGQGAGLRALAPGDRDAGIAYRQVKIMSPGRRSRRARNHRSERHTVKVRLHHTPDRSARREGLQ